MTQFGQMAMAMDGLATAVEILLEKAAEDQELSGAMEELIDAARTLEAVLLERASEEPIR